ncbi:carotenoid oxygenase family protein [Pseudanabaena sp. PCC 6802]|uniref:carotenoid oxygenase family protein n=1 Tax=Pseudanabaena sp. PCC 6802 TaxID=118173 RepID=UPI00034C1CFE|nr:carotenoid oxygenase family protein [Pseudanabaena sp. PCC 6802]
MTGRVFLPKSIVETTSEAIASRRQERDVNDLDVQVCFYCDRETYASLNLSAGVVTEIIELPSGYLLCVDCHKQGEDIAISQEVLELAQKIHPDIDFLENQLPLPRGLHGYAFHVAPIPPVIPYGKRSSRGFRMALNGDGMVFRLGFESGKAHLKSRIPKPPEYYADQATNAFYADEATKNNHYWMAFRDGGLARTSLLLGNPDQLNTAFLVTKEHLLLTFDAGRPYIVDPDTLEVIQPTGATQEWLSMFPGVPIPFTFLGMQSPAHPVCDVRKTSSTQDEFFTTNYSTGYNGGFAFIVNFFFHIMFWINKIINVILGRQKPSCKGYKVSYTDLLRYRFRQGASQAILERWRLVRRDNHKPVAIQQTMHQMGITEDYIILADIAFKMEFSQIFSPFILGWIHDDFWMLPGLKWLRYQVGSFLNACFLRLIKPKPFTQFYIVNRKDLDTIPGGSVENTEDLPTLEVTPITLPKEVSHYAVDYQNPDGQILIQVAHNNNWDATEWITEFETSNPNKPLRTDLKGINAGTMDLGSLAKYTIDAKTGAVNRVGNLVVDRDKNTWSPSVYTHRELCRDRATESSQTVKNIFWMSWGFSWEIIPGRVYEAYKQGNNRTLPIEQMPSDDKPMSLVRLDTTTMQIADYFEFPFGHFVRSPQFIPSSELCPADRDISVHGYVVCLVLGDSPEGKPKDEYWVFHAYDLKGKPIYRLSHEELQLGLTIHSTWIPNLQRDKYSEAERQQLREDSVRRDYEELVDRACLSGRKKRELFDTVVYEGYIRQVAEQDLKDFYKQQGWQP